MRRPIIGAERAGVHLARDATTGISPIWALIAVVTVVAGTILLLAFARRETGSSLDAAETVRSMMADRLAGQGYEASALRDVTCLMESPRRFECSLVVNYPDVGDQRMGATLSCGSSDERTPCRLRLH